MQIRPRMEEGWSTLILLWAMILISSAAITQSDLIDGLHVIPMVGSIAVLAGTLLAKSRFSNNTAHLFSLVYGLFVVFYLVGTTESFTGMAWRDRILDPVDGIVARQMIWLEDLFMGGTNRDGLLFVFQTSLVYWLLGYTAAWYTYRIPRVWRVVVPTGLVLLSVVYYYEGPHPLQLYLAFYALLALLFVARTYLAEQERTWRAGSVRYERWIWFNFIRASFVAALLALIFAWGLPPLSASATVSDAIGGAKGPWREFQDNWTRMFSALRTYGTTVADPYQETLVLGGPRTVGNTPVMDIFVSERLPYVYWQAIVYDTYEDGTWHYREDPFTEHFPDDGLIDVPSTRSRQVVTQTVVTYFPNSSFIYGAPEIISVDRPLNVYASTDAQGNQLVSAVRSKFVLQQGDRYKVTSRLSTADATSLRSASLDYPDWIKETYLQLSDDVTQDTFDLAEEITAPFDNPFDKAIAVRDYLRQNISYNDQIAATPNQFDPVHYFLFVSQEGYCNYYASAMAVMLRSQDIPARVVSGYAQGGFNEDSSSYRVSASNAHTWVEVYFPEYGWIQFEPTASIPTVDRPEVIDDAGGGDAFGAFLDQEFPVLDDELLQQQLGLEGQRPDGSSETPDLDALNLEENAFFDRIPLWQAVTAASILLLAIVLSVVANELNKRVEADVEKSYSRLGSWARWLGLSYRPVDTPYERADKLATAVPEGRDSIRQLTEEFVVRQFGPIRDFVKPFDPTPIWKDLRPLLLRKSIARQVQRWRSWRFRDSE